MCGPHSAWSVARNVRASPSGLHRQKRAKLSWYSFMSGSRRRIESDIDAALMNSTSEGRGLSALCRLPPEGSHAQSFGPDQRPSRWARSRPGPLSSEIAAFMPIGRVTAAGLPARSRPAGPGKALGPQIKTTYIETCRRRGLRSV